MIAKPRPHRASAPLPPHLAAFFASPRPRGKAPEPASPPAHGILAELARLGRL